MNFDDYESLWRAQPAPALSLPAASAEREAIFDRVRREARRFDRAIFWRDTREIVVSLAVAVYFGLSAWRHTGAGHIAWGQWLAVALILGVAIVFLIDRRNMPRPAAAESPMLDQIDNALAGQRYQARVLSQIPWSYALPLSLAIAASASDSIIGKHGISGLWSPAGVAIAGLSFFGGCFVVWLNRLALRKVISPKITELEQLRRELSDE